MSQAQPTPGSTQGVEPYVAQRFERWFEAHALDLPAETRTQFIAMGVEAIERWPDRGRDEVLDELIAELDGRLTRIVDETAASHEAKLAQGRAPRAGTAGNAPVRPAGRLARLFGRRDRAT